MKLLLKKVEEVPLANKHLLHGVLLLLVCSNSKCDPQLERCCLCAVLDRSSACSPSERRADGRSGVYYPVLGRGRPPNPLSPICTETL